MTLVVRPAGPGDTHRLDELAEIALGGLQNRRGGPGLQERWMGTSEGGTARSHALSHLMDLPHLELVAHSGDEIYGVALAWIGIHAGSFTVYVGEGHRHAGVGPLLASAAQEWLEDSGCVQIDALALPGDRAMKNLLEKSGFKARLLTLRRGVSSHLDAGEQPGAEAAAES